VAIVWVAARSSATGSGTAIAGGGAAMRATSWATLIWGAAGRAIDGGTPRSV
jgi:hypothetical protein